MVWEYPQWVSSEEKGERREGILYIKYTSWKIPHVPTNGTHVIHEKKTRKVSMDWEYPPSVSPNACWLQFRLLCRLNGAYTYPKNSKFGVEILRRKRL